MDIKNLYSDEKFNNLLSGITSTNKIVDFEDFKQDVFSEILESKNLTYDKAVSSARRVGMRYYRQPIESDVFNLSTGDNKLSLDEIMSNTVFNGSAKFV